MGRTSKAVWQLRRPVACNPTGGMVVEQQVVVGKKREEVLARMVSAEYFDPKAIEYAINKLGENPRYLNCRLVLQVLVSRLLDDTTGQTWGSHDPIDLGLTGRVEHVLRNAGNENESLLTAVAMDAAIGIGQAHILELEIFERLRITLTPRESDTWQVILAGEKPSWREIAEACSTRNWTSTPDGRDILLYDHCRRAMANPTKRSVTRLATDFASMGGLEEMPDLREALVRASLWGDCPKPLVAVFSERMGIFWPEILKVLCEDLLSHSTWERPGVTDAVFANARRLGRALIDGFAAIPDSERDAISEQILTARNCPWWWWHWEQLLPVLTDLTQACHFFDSWGGGPFGDGLHPSVYALAVRRLHKHVKSPGESWAARLPIEAAARTAYFYSGSQSGNTFNRLGLPTIAEEHQAEFTAALREPITEGYANASALLAVLETTPDRNVVKRMLRSWLHADHATGGYPFSDQRQEECVRLVALMKEFDIAAFGTRFFNSNIGDLWRGGYHLKPYDVDAPEKMRVLIEEGRSGKHEIQGSCFWADPESAQTLLCSGYSAWSLIWSVLETLGFDSKLIEDPVGWLEATLAPVCESDPEFRKTFCDVAWSRAKGSRYARAFLASDDRFRRWMDDEEQALMRAYCGNCIWEMSRNEGDMLKAVLSADEIVDSLLTHGKIMGDKGQLIHPELFADLFAEGEPRRRLVGFFTSHFEEVNMYDLDEWIRACGLRDNPAIRRLLEKMLDRSDVPMESVIELLG